MKNTYHHKIEEAIWLMLKEFIIKSKKDCELFKSETDLVINYYYWLTRNKKINRSRIHAEYPTEKGNNHGRYDLVIMNAKNKSDGKPEAILEFKYIPNKGHRGKTIREAPKNKIPDLTNLEEVKGSQNYFILFSCKNFDDPTIDNYAKALMEYKNHNLRIIVVFWRPKEQKKIYIAGRWKFPKEIQKVCGNIEYKKLQ